jgi:hypothetical protein
MKQKDVLFSLNINHNTMNLLTYRQVIYATDLLDTLCIVDGHGRRGK